MKPFVCCTLLLLTIAFSMAQKPRIYIPDLKKTNILSDTVAYGYNGGTHEDVFTFTPDILEQLTKKIPADKLAYVITYSRRENYPAGFSSLFTWSYDKLKPAFLYYVATVNYQNQEYTLVEMPAAENKNNKNLADNLKPQTDIYFLTSDFYTHPYFDLGGNKQYAKKITDEEDKSNAYFKSFREVMGDGIIDASLYFKTTAPVPALTKDDYAKMYNDMHSIAAARRAKEHEAFVIEYEKQKKTADSAIADILSEEKSTVAFIDSLSKDFVHAYFNGKTFDFLTALRYWDMEEFRYDTAMQVAENSLNKQTVSYTVNSEIEFTPVDDIVEVTDETVFTANMMTSIGYTDHPETFRHGQRFKLTSNVHILENTKGDHYYEDGFTGNTQFLEEPWNYFAGAVAQFNNIVVVQNITIDLMHVSKVVDYHANDGENHWIPVIRIENKEKGYSLSFVPKEIMSMLYRLKNEEARYNTWYNKSF